jgi:Secretion system C-terminal sorting domain
MKKVLFFLFAILSINLCAQNSANNTCSCLVIIDTSYSSLPACDDCTTVGIHIPFTFNLFGTIYDTMWIHNNGVISFDGPAFSLNAIPIPRQGSIVIAPFWADEQTMIPGSGHVYYKVTPSAIIVRWDSVGYFANHIDKLNTFQVIITDGNNPIIAPGNNVEMCYGEMQWTTGDASGGGTNGFGGTSALVGANGGDSTHYIQIGLFDTAGVNYYSQTAFNNQVGWLSNKSFVMDASTTTNIPPILANNYYCDTVITCLGETSVIDELFLSPEPGQTTSLTINLSGTFGATVVSNTGFGNMVSGEVQIFGSMLNYGCSMLSFIAIDNGIPADTIIKNITVCTTVCASVGQSEMQNPNSELTISPNPFTDQTIITFTKEQKNTTIKVMNVLGECVLTSLPLRGGLEGLLDLSSLSRGIYFVRIEDENKNVVNKKIIKE